MIKNNTIAGVVVLYNPLSNVISNINSYIDQVDALFVMDNSDKQQAETVDRIKAFNNTTYLRMGGNIGLAAALNIGAAKALEQGYDYLLTMDQDSKAAPDMVSKLRECLNSHDPSRIGIVSPFHMIKTAHRPINRGCKEVLTAMTSGNLVNLNIFRAVGPFMEELFIDYIDHEYCLRLHQRGYRVLQSYEALLEHNQGDIIIYDLFFRKTAATNHSAFRHYYMTRNRFFLMRRYRKEHPSYYWAQWKDFLRDLLFVLLFEEQKKDKLAKIWTGYRDYRRGFGVTQ
ncbi:MAG: glycosyltransferase family 2 protein [Nitrospirota bacterium]